MNDIIQHQQKELYMGILALFIACIVTLFIIWQLYPKEKKKEAVWLIAIGVLATIFNTVWLLS